MGQHSKTRSITLIALITALTVALSLNFIIPVPQTKGFVTICDGGIYLAAMLLGGYPALLVGGLSGALLDLLSGYPQWLIFSLIIHGLQGLIAGKIIYQKSASRTALGLSLASILMIAGYAFAGWLLNGWGYGLASLPGNLIQNIFGVLIAVPAFKVLQKLKLTELYVK
ncbi:MAG: ECF transporter S component [Streptococcaceae bacterium]|jgi:uncharacterized membrane protein|nr:ECF transporter S component [Streptococcaceae bacterium]